MDTVDRLLTMLPEEVAHELQSRRGKIREVRMRVGRPVQLVCDGTDEILGEPLLPQTLRRMLSALMDYSLHTRESELKQGFFTLSDGSRAGVCGRMTLWNENPSALSSVGSICIRIARDVRGCADALMPFILSTEGIRSLLVVSSPGNGKTTMLRDIARQLSSRGVNVSVSDERHELAACCQGIPSVDLGPRTDVLDGCPKHIAIGQLVRAMAPDVIVTDEIGDERDAWALADAVRCGIAMIASVHSRNLEDLAERPGLRAPLCAGTFDFAVLLKSPPGTIGEITRFGGVEKGLPVWKCA